ncbi:hypothetical protein K466DRAFT_468560, partial [Polyporus arcularius HHB13444]
VTNFRQNRHVLPPAEYATLRNNLVHIVTALDDARHKSTDPPEQPALPIIETVRTGKRGRPAKPIDPTFLRHALAVRGPARISKALKCSSRHVRREALRHGLVEPAPPVIRHVQHPDGSQSRIHTSQTAPVSTLTDPELDAVLTEILTAYPGFGHVMLVGALRALHTNNRAQTVLDLFLES